MIVAADIWNKLIQKASTSDFEIHTVPQNKSIPLWFKVWVQRDHVMISRAEDHTPSVNISSDRKISYRDFEFVLKCYNRWMNGDSRARQDAVRISQNSAYIFALIAEMDRQDSRQIIMAERRTGRLTVAGDLTAARNVNKDILVNELKLEQVSNTTIFLRGDLFVLSPSVQNSYNWFDLRLVNLKQFDRNRQQGYLLIRFFDQFLLADLRDFLRKMISKENFVKTKVSGVHWKFLIKKVENHYIIVNQTDKKQFEIAVVDLAELKARLDGASVTAIKRADLTDAPNDKPIAANRMNGLKNRVNLLIENSNDHAESLDHKSIQENRSGLMGWFLKIFKG